MHKEQSLKKNVIRCKGKDDEQNPHPHPHPTKKKEKKKKWKKQTEIRTFKNKNDELKNMGDS